jgi:hypothetical protein
LAHSYGARRKPIVERRNNDGSNNLKISNRILQKGLAFRGETSGTVVIPGRLGRSEILPRRLICRGGALMVRRQAVINRMEDLNVKSCKETITRKI